jgi:hypothetical protein
MSWLSQSTLLGTGVGVITPHWRFISLMSLPPGQTDFINSSGIQRDEKEKTKNSYLRQMSSPGQGIKYSSNKTYIFKTKVVNFNSGSQSSFTSLATNGFAGSFGGSTLVTYVQPYKKLELTTPWNSIIKYEGYTASGIVYSSVGGGGKNILISNPTIQWKKMADTLPYQYTNTDSDKSCTLQYVTSPPQNYNIPVKFTYKATHLGFGFPSVITESDVIEIDWKIQGWAFATSTQHDFYEGWSYNEITKSFKYIHASKNFNSQTTLQKVKYPFGTTHIGGSRIGNPDNYIGFTGSNYISRYLDYEKFNFYFTFDSNNSLGYVDIYTSDSLPNNSKDTTKFYNGTNNLNGLNKKNFITRIQKDITNPNPLDVKLWGLTGQRYLIIVANYTNTNISYQINITNISIEGSYSEEDNNVQRLFTNTNQYVSPTTLSVIGTSPDSLYSLTTTTDITRHQLTTPGGFAFIGATGDPGFFNSLIGTVSNLSLIESKVGNGTFRAGIWENGVWNNGWRVDTTYEEFDDVSIAINLDTKNIRWRIQITGTTQSASSFDLGDKVSIGNIVAVDINDKRKLFKNYFTVVSRGTNSLTLETENNFPLRRIQRDSENHKIRVAKNVWLNGAFLNGYFEGVWNNGLFKGYPLITEMYDSHWIDGEFDGGHFSGQKLEWTFTDTYYIDGYVGLTFGATAHGFVLNDVIEIDKFDKTVNPQYDGEYVVTDVINKTLIKTSREWGGNTPAGSEGGIVRRKTKTGLIQNFKFKDNNIAKYNEKTLTNGNPDYVFSSSDKLLIWNYNSWIDVTYSTYSTTNIGKNRVLFNPIPNSPEDIFNSKYGLGEFTAMNLYGYITDDVLSSESFFRDIDSQVRRKYNLGTKYDIYEDYIGEGSDFNDPFSTDINQSGLSNFYADGWTFSITGPNVLRTLKWEFIDNSFYTGGKIGFIGPAVEIVDVDPPNNWGNDHIIQIGQQIFITQSAVPNPTNLTYEGTASVIALDFVYFPSGSEPQAGVLTYSRVVIDKNFALSTPLEGGFVYYKQVVPIPYTFSRTLDGTLKVEQPSGSLQVMVFDNENIKIPRRRYSTIEFDIVDIDMNEQYFDINPIYLFNFTNFMKDDQTASNTHAFPSGVSTINYKKTGRVKQREYFYNRFGLDIGILNYASLPGTASLTTPLSLVKGTTVEFDNIKFYETDMIPFFQYTTEEYVNKGVQVPFSGLAPFIDYTDENFSFVENIVISLDSVQLNETNTTVSGVSSTGFFNSTTTSAQSSNQSGG